MKGDRHYEHAVVHVHPDCPVREDPYVGGIYLMPNGWIDLIDDELLIPRHNALAIEYQPEPGIEDKLDPR